MVKQCWCWVLPKCCEVLFDTQWISGACGKAITVLWCHILPNGCQAVHWQWKTSVEVGPLTHSCLQIAPEWRNSRSRGHREAVWRAQWCLSPLHCLGAARDCFGSAAGAGKCCAGQQRGMEEWQEGILERVFWGGGRPGRGSSGLGKGRDIFQDWTPFAGLLNSAPNLVQSWVSPLSRGNIILRRPHACSAPKLSHWAAFMVKRVKR